MFFQHESFCFYPYFFSCFAGGVVFWRREGQNTGVGGFLPEGGHFDGGWFSAERHFPARIGTNLPVGKNPLNLFTKNTGIFYLILPARGYFAGRGDFSWRGWFWWTVEILMSKGKHRRRWEDKYDILSFPQSVPPSEKSPLPAVLYIRDLLNQNYQLELNLGQWSARKIKQE